MPDAVKSVIGLLSLIVTIQGVAVAGAVITGKVTAVKPGHRVNTVVHVEYVDGEYRLPSRPVVMDQRDLEFVPHVLPVLAGTTVDFLNSDDVLHNVFTPDECDEKFNLGSWPKGGRRSHLFEAPSCLAVMLCNVHPEMEAYIVVLQNPYFALTDAEGEYKIEDVPAGIYTLKVWHERLKADPVEITVPESGEIEVNFDLRR